MRRCVLALCVLSSLLPIHAGCGPSPGGIGSSGVAPTLALRDRGHAVLLLVDPRLHGDFPRSREERNHDLEWVNLLSAHFGSCDVATLDRLASDGEALLAQRRVLILPRHCLAAMDSSYAPTLDAAVQKGLTVMAELPDRSWSERIGLRRNAIERRGPLPWPRPSRADFARPELHESPPAPLTLEYEVGSYWPGRGRLGAPRVLSSPTGRPLQWHYPMGDGFWILLGIDLAQLSSTLRQGMPDEDLRLRNRFAATLAPALSAADFTAAPELLRADWPWLDRWSIAFLDDRHASSPWPRIWPCPLDVDGWLLGAAPEPIAWQERFDITLSELAGHSLVSAFGPDGDARGWLFGSSLPFHPLSADGGLHHVLILPQLGTRGDRLSTWLRRNGSGAQGPVTLVQPMDDLRDAARSAHHRVADPAEFAAFWNLRDAVRMNWSFTDGWLRVDLLSEGSSEAAEPPTVALPLRHRDWVLSAWELDPSPARARRTRSFDRAYLRVELPQGRSTLRARYERAR